MISPRMSRDSEGSTWRYPRLLALHVGAGQHPADAVAGWGLAEHGLHVLAEGGPGASQERLDLPVSLVHGDIQRRPPVRVGGVDRPRVGLEDRSHPGGVAQDHGGGQVDGAPLEEQLQELSAPLSQIPAAASARGSLQGRLAHGVPGVHVGAPIQQQPGDLGVAAVGRLVQGRPLLVPGVPEGDRGVDEVRVRVEVGLEPADVAQEDEMARVVAAPGRDQGFEGGNVGGAALHVGPLVGGDVQGGQAGRAGAVGIPAVGEVEPDQAGIAEEAGIADGGLAPAAGLAAEGVDVGPVLDEQPGDLVLGVAGVLVDADNTVQKGAAPRPGAGRLDPRRGQAGTGLQQLPHHGRVLGRGVGPQGAVSDGGHHGEQSGDLLRRAIGVLAAAVEGEAGHGHPGPVDGPHVLAAAPVVGDEGAQGQAPVGLAGDPGEVPAGPEDGDVRDQLQRLVVGARGELHRVPGAADGQGLRDRREGAGLAAVASRGRVVVHMEAGPQVLQDHLEIQGRIAGDAALQDPRVEAVGGHPDLVRPLRDGSGRAAQGVGGSGRQLEPVLPELEPGAGQGLPVLVLDPDGHRAQVAAGAAQDQPADAAAAGELARGRGPGDPGGGVGLRVLVDGGHVEAEDHPRTQLDHVLERIADELQGPLVDGGPALPAHRGPGAGTVQRHLADTGNEDGGVRAAGAVGPPGRAEHVVDRLGPRTRGEVDLQGVRVLVAGLPRVDAVVPHLDGHVDPLLLEAVPGAEGGGEVQARVQVGAADVGGAVGVGVAADRVDGDLRRPVVEAAVDGDAGDGQGQGPPSAQGDRFLVRRLGACRGGGQRQQQDCARPPPGRGARRVHGRGGFRCRGRSQGSR